MGGRGASFSSSGRMSSVSDARNFNQLKSYVKDKLGIELNDNVKDLDFGMVKEYTAGMEDVIRDFPGVAGNTSLGFIKTDESKRMVHGAQAGLGRGGMNLNKAFFSNPKKANEDLKQQTEAGWTFGKPTVRSLAHHEMGHAVERRLQNAWQLSEMKKLPPLSAPTRRINNYSEAGNQIKTISKRKDKELGKKGEFLSRHNTSKYGHTNDGEAFAEAFADYYGSGGKTKNQLSKELVNESKKRWKERIKK